MPGLLEDTIQRAGRQIIVWFPGDGHSPGFCRMLELSMISASCDQEPAIFMYQAQDFPDLHHRTISGSAAVDQTFRALRCARLSLADLVN